MFQRVLVANRMPTDDGGAVATLRDRTEVEQLGRELDSTRGLLDASRLLDMYALLLPQLQVTLGYPSAESPDPLADQAYTVAAGNWQGGFSPDLQGDWASDFASLAACKPSVKGVTWAQLTDGESHQFPHCGLLDSAGRGKPALAQLRMLRERHFR